jgi:hypothetical protein
MIWMLNMFVFALLNVVSLYLLLSQPITVVYALMNWIRLAQSFYFGWIIIFRQNPKQIPRFTTYTFDRYSSLKEDFFTKIYEKPRVLFFGSGANKN